MSRWSYYVAPGGGDAVAKEIQKARLTKTEATKLDEVMERVSDGVTRSGDVDHLRGDVLEVRAKGERRELRLYFARVSGGHLCLGLRFVVKKSKAARGTDVDLAVQRLVTWRASRD